MPDSDWQLPNRSAKVDNAPRHVGVEFELQGIELEQLAELVASSLSGSAEALSKAEYKITTEAYGDFIVEADFALLKDMARAKAKDSGEDASGIETLAVDMLAAASSLVVPCEVVSPPIPMHALAKPMDVLTTDIRAAGGKGTGQSPFFAFGLHLNVEPPDLEAQTVLSYLKAFVCLFDWLVVTGEVDLARRATPYIQRYPKDYELLITDPDYWPDMDQLIDDYLRFNASRNRALDMLPMFAELDEKTVKNAVDDDLIKARPAFHYRLANCEIDDSKWSVENPWNRWLQIESLAERKEDLDQCCIAYQADRDRLLSKIDNDWLESLVRWIDDSIGSQSNQD